MARITASDLRDRVRLEMREEVNDGWGGTAPGDGSSATLASCSPRVARPSLPRACKASSQP